MYAHAHGPAHAYYAFYAQQAHPSHNHSLLHLNLHPKSLKSSQYGVCFLYKRCLQYIMLRNYFQPSTEESNGLWSFNPQLPLKRES